MTTGTGTKRALKPDHVRDCSAIQGSSQASLKYCLPAHTFLVDMMLRTGKMGSKRMDISGNPVTEHISVSVVIPRLNKANFSDFYIDDAFAELREVSRLKMQVALVPRTARANCHEN